MRHALSIALLAFFAVFVLEARPAQAQLYEVQNLHFGEWLVTNNNGPRSVTVQTDGNYIHSPELIMMTPPQPGIYRIDGLAPFAAISSIDVTPVQPLMGGGAQIFLMDNFTVLHPNADGTGSAIITLGARARTSGNGQGYEDGVYNGVLDLVINL